MDIALKVQNSKFQQTEIQETVAYALRTEAEQARLRRDYFADLCNKFENQYNLTSDEFIRRFEQGELGDESDMFDWYAAKRGLDLWERRYRILTEVLL
jgi:hypothetical protein